MVLGFYIQAQDLHNSDYRFNPLYLNPALTGGLEGNLRAGAIHRDQFRTFLGKAYQSTSIWLDSPVSFVFNEKTWLGLGANFYRDLVGDLGLGHNGIIGSAALHLSLDKKYKKVFAVGIQYGYLQKKLNQNSAGRFQDQILSSSPSPDLELLDQFQHSTADLNFGVNWTQAINKYQKYSIGISMHHLNGLFNSTPNPSFLDNRINMYGDWTAQLNSRFLLQSTLNASILKNYSILQLQLHGNYQLKKKGNKYLTSGIGMRMGDALQLMGGMIVKGWQVSICYDLTVSTARVYNNSAGAIEIGIIETIVIPKKPVVEPKIICPRT